MERLPEFFGNHVELCLAFLFLLGGLIWTFTQSSSRGLVKLSPADATRLINSEDALVLDVRSESEFNRGHIVNSRNVPMDQLDDQIGKLEKHRQRAIITACRTGQQSAAAGSRLRRQGFENVYHLTGGLAAWEGASLGAAGGDARRLILARLVADRRLGAHDPLSAGTSDWDEKAFDLLLAADPVPLDVAAELASA